MSVYIRVASIATILIGLLLFSLKVVDAKAEFDVVHNSSSSLLFVASNPELTGWHTSAIQNSQEFEPFNNGGPRNTRGTGTR
jgi:hypothetical protein